MTPDTPRTVIRPGADDAAVTLGLGAAVLAGPPPIVVPMPIVAMIAVRVLRVYLQTFLGLLGADGIGVIEVAPPHEAWTHLYRIGLISLAPSAVSLAQNALEFLTRLDVRSPAFRA